MNSNHSCHLKSSSSVKNFGENVRFLPAAVFSPHSEDELLEIMRANPGRRIRAVGRLHSWSEVTCCEDILIDLRHYKVATLYHDKSNVWVEVGAGCQIKNLLDQLRNQGGFTLPSLGLITEQTIAGAASTGTHGSGRNSLSHYIQSVRVACFDRSTGEPIIRDISDGEELRAARCSLGCLGIITSLRMSVRKEYFVEEYFQQYDRLEQVLQREEDFPLQQFFLVPWRWDYYAQHRRERPGPRSRFAWLYRLYWSVIMDVGLHLVVRLLARHLPNAFTPFFFRRILSHFVPRCWRVVDRSDKQLTMEHELFRHIEIEIFVTRSQLSTMLEFVIWLLRNMSGEEVELSESIRKSLKTVGLDALIRESRGTYTHHYPICIRKVLPDETMISMTAGATDPCYAVSFISYARPDQRQGFTQFAEILANATSMLFDARPHWGKLCPLSKDKLALLYPELTRFAAICRQHDPQSLFGNDWTNSLLSEGKDPVGEEHPNG